ncbi:hypothetical protein HZH66_013612 [Vespula vulgaris]|uniref:Uncharacterized protein n=1 Tax=Vespula vulgaris TaxID=7454 RepID=A0A834J643_VESVU|nr:hypothetical protein HZH66_013612 [Vespula vulgaris]
MVDSHGQRRTTKLSMNRTMSKEIRIARFYGEPEQTREKNLATVQQHHRIFRVSVVLESNVGPNHGGRIRWDSVERSGTRRIFSKGSLSPKDLVDLSTNPISGAGSRCVVTTNPL